MGHLAVFAVLGGTAGCAGATAPRPAFDPERRLLSVPFFPDDTDQCGPSALAGVLSYWGPMVDPSSLRKEAYLADLKGSLSVDLLLAAKRRGFAGRLYRGTLADLKKEVDRGRPVIAFLNLGFRSVPVGHYVVVTGYDDARGGLYIHSGRDANRFVSYKAFRKDWEKTDRSALLVLPRERAKGS